MFEGREKGELERRLNQYSANSAMTTTAYLLGEVGRGGGQILGGEVEEGCGGGEEGGGEVTGQRSTFTPRMSTPSIVH